MKAPRFTLRLKLALVLLFLLAIPLIGFRQIASINSFLLEKQEQAMASTAKTIAAILKERPELFEPAVLQNAAAGKAIVPFLLQRPIRLDGDTTDWGGLLGKAANYGQQNILEIHDIYDPQSSSFKFLSGRYENSLYLLFIVKDDHLIYREKYSLRLDNCDHLQIALENEGGLLDSYVVAPERPGPVHAFFVLNGPGHYRTGFSEKRIQGAWKETKDGYIIELRMPLDLIPADRISFAIADVNDPASRAVETEIGTGGVRRVADLGVLLANSPELEKILKALHRPASQIWVVDRQKRVRAFAGSLETGKAGSVAEIPGRHEPFLMGLIRRASRIFRPQRQDSSFAQPTASEFNLDQLQKVLAGKALTTLRPAGEGGRQIVAAAEPVWIDKGIRGAVVVQQPTDTILSMRNRMIEQIILATSVVFLIGAALLLFFASRLAGRIRQLRSQTDRAIARDGRIIGPFEPVTGSDELGDLSRYFAAMINRLQEYHRHQEKMADHLEHEMRTPLAGISASLANLGRQLGPAHSAVQDYLLDARKNLQRLEGILTSIREAATIKDALRQDEQEKFDLCTALRTWTESYRKMFGKVRFSLTTPAEAIHIMADPNRIFQMMDKLVENAVDFSPDGATVAIRLEQDGENAVIEVLNEGPRLDENRANQLFHSMVSERSSRNDEKIHMGLGLFIVRSIVEFHGGQVKAANRSDTVQGVVFTVILPMHTWVKDISIRG